MGRPGTRRICVQVGLEHRGGVVFRHAVQHHLDAGRAEAAVRHPPVRQLRQLLKPLAPVPPHRADHVHPQRPRAGGPQVGAGWVDLSRHLADDRVLPAGDPERQQVGLGGEERGVVVIVGHLGQQPRHQGHGALLEHAGRLAAGVALDPAVRRVRGARVDSGQAQRPAVHPGPVAVAVRQVHRAVRHHGVQRLPGRDAAGEGGQFPAAAGDPFLVRVLAGVAGDDLQVVRLGAGLAQVAAA